MYMIFVNVILDMIILCLHYYRKISDMQKRKASFNI